MIDNALNIVS